MSERWATDLAEEILKKSGLAADGGVMLAEVVSVTPLSIRLHDQIVTKNLYINPVYTIGESDLKLADAPHSGSWDAFLKAFHKAFTIIPGDQLVVYLQGKSFYILERVSKAT